MIFCTRSMFFLQPFEMKPDQFPFYFIHKENKNAFHFAIGSTFNDKIKQYFNTPVFHFIKADPTAAPKNFNLADCKTTI